MMIFFGVQAGRKVAADREEVSRLFPRAHTVLIQQPQGWKNYSILDLVAKGQEQKSGIMI